jgi:hypothetical protein
MKKLFVWIFIFIFAASMAACGSSKSESTAPAPNSVSAVYNDNGNVNRDNSENAGNASTVTNSDKAELGTGNEAKNEAKKDSQQSKALITSANVNQKIIFTGQVSMETLNFEKTRTDLCNYINNVGGFAQNSSFQGGRLGDEGLRSAEYVFRIPKAKFNEAFVDFRKFGTVVSEQLNGEDVTNQYIDTEARLKSLKIQQERLEELLKKAVKMDDIISLEKELQSTIYEIENYTGSIKKWDSLVEYSTLTVKLNEVRQISKETPKEQDGFLSRLQFSFKNSAEGLWNFLKDVAVFIAAALPIAIPLLLICYLIYRFFVKKLPQKKKITKESENDIDKEG